MNKLFPANEHTIERVARAQKRRLHDAAEIVAGGGAAHLTAVRH